MLVVFKKCQTFPADSVDIWNIFLSVCDILHLKLNTACLRIQMSALFDFTNWELDSSSDFILKINSNYSVKL